MSLLAKGENGMFRTLAIKTFLILLLAYLSGLNSPILYVCLQLDLQCSFETLIKKRT